MRNLRCCLDERLYYYKAGQVLPAIWSPIWSPFGPLMGYLGYLGYLGHHLGCFSVNLGYLGEILVLRSC